MIMLTEKQQAFVQMFQPAASKIEKQPPFCGDRAGSVIAFNAPERSSAAAAGYVAAGLVGEEGNIFSARACTACDKSA